MMRRSSRISRCRSAAMPISRSVLSIAGRSSPRYIPLNPSIRQLVFNDKNTCTLSQFSGRIKKSSSRPPPLPPGEGWGGGRSSSASPPSSSSAPSSASICSSLSFRSRRSLRRFSISAALQTDGPAAQQRAASISFFAWPSCRWRPRNRCRAARSAHTDA